MLSEHTLNSWAPVVGLKLTASPSPPSPLRLQASPSSPKLTASPSSPLVRYPIVTSVSIKNEQNIRKPYIFTKPELYEIHI
uniref:Uncharacterized protein n=1 Tax=Solanum lycopersicum TaxID=4081 RepID=A0A3Q7HQ94_SOLLC